MIRAAVLMSLLATSAAAQQYCAPRDVVIKRLTDQYGETLLGAGLQNNRRFLEVWTSDHAGTWTLLYTHADGVSCIMASGRNWRIIQRPNGVPG